MTTKDYIKAGLTGIWDTVRDFAISAAAISPLLISIALGKWGLAAILFGVYALASAAATGIKTAKWKAELEEINH